MLNTEGRHRAVQEFEDMFEFAHLAEGVPQETSRIFHETAEMLLTLLPDGPQLTRALHRLWEAKNEAVFLAVRHYKELQREHLYRG